LKDDRPKLGGSDERLSCGSHVLGCDLPSKYFLFFTIDSLVIPESIVVGVFFPLFSFVGEEEIVIPPSLRDKCLSDRLCQLQLWVLKGSERNENEQSRP
jgi:hypothetical protein